MVALRILLVIALFVFSGSCIGIILKISYFEDYKYFLLAFAVSFCILLIMSALGVKIGG